MTPKIGNNCYIDLCTKIFGDIALGDFTPVRASAVVNRSYLQTGDVLIGIPAKSERIVAVLSCAEKQ